MELEWLLLLGFLMGWAVGLIQGSANLKARVRLAIELESARVMERMNLLESELRWAKAKVQSLESDLERVNLKASEKATEMIQNLVKEKVEESMSESALARGMVLDSVQGLVLDSARAVELVAAEVEEKE